MGLLSACWLAVALGAGPVPGAAGPVRIAADVEAFPIAAGVWRFVTWLDLPPYGRTPANGLLVVSGREALLVNTGWNDAQADRLADWVERTLGAKVTLVIPTHAHQDTIGGLAALHRRGAESWAQEQTASIARAAGREVPHRLFGESHQLRVGDRAVDLAFRGAGHTADNVVVWLPAERILFGGCLVKAAGAKDLGSVEDASLSDWPATLGSVMARYPSPGLVIPGHGEPGDAGLLAHTLELARAAGKGGKP
jgi:metallo-beta-lactamase class B